KLPLNARMINLNNYPPNISPVAKRQFSVIMQRVKSENVNNPDKCIQILKQNIQFIFNKEIKQLVDQFKMSFIDPAVKNFNKNKTNPKISENDMLVFLLSLIEDAKNNIFETDSENFESKYASNDLAKRKLDSESSEDVTGSELSDESLRKKSKCLANEINLNDNQKNVKKELIFDSDTKFVLGKNVNDVFLEIQQQFYEVNSEDSNSSVTLNDSINPKSIYSRFPNLFRYEADQQDRQWLNENHIIKRKNIKCNILLLDDIFELFKNNFKLNSNVVVNEKNDDNRQEQNETQDEKDLILKNLKTFCLPEFILNKLNKRYSIKNSKFI
ncbi:deoxynucleotidyltransferase terminal-interacting 1, partial [Brachionus plicatilis]